MKRRNQHHEFLVTAEVWKALPGVALKSLAEDFTRRPGELDNPEEWAEVSACLIPKIPAPKELRYGSYGGTRGWNFSHNWSSTPSKRHSSEEWMRHRECIH